MSATKPLLDLFRVDKQLRGLKNRLEDAERFLTKQKSLLDEMDKQRKTLEAQLKQLKASVANEEGEAARLGAREASLREQMNSAQNAKEYKAFQTELEKLKTQKSEAETRQLEAMAKVDAITKQLESGAAQHADRTKIVGSASSDRDTKASEIKERVEELTKQRAELAAKVPPAELKKFDDLVRVKGDEAMAPVEVVDRRSHEGNCGSCNVVIPVEAVSALMSGRLVNCPSCRCILYVEEETFAKVTPEKKPKAPKAPKAKKSEEPAST
jgi:predicted  nucleic acid-binding Zn-ribbon protein